MTAVSAVTWRDPEAQQPGLGTLRTRRIDGVERVFAGVDHDGSRHLLLEISDLGDAFSDDRSRGVTVGGRMLEEGGRAARPFLDVRCIDPAGFDAFDVIANDILTHISAGMPAPQAVAVVLARWRRFWGGVPAQGLTADEVRGLFGELWFLLVWLLPQSLEQVLRWIGPSGGRHDFQWTRLAVEAKTTASVRGHIHRINGIDQLDPPDDGALYVFSLRVREEPASTNSLPGLVDRVVAALQARADLLDEFELRLARARYSPAHAERYRTTRFRIVDERLYAVRASFPRLSASDLSRGVPTGVERIEYEVNLESCADLIISRDAASPGVTFTDAT